MRARLGGIFRNVRRHAPLILLSLALVTVFVVYFSVTRFHLYADDFTHLAALENRGPLEFIVSPWSGHMYLVRNVVFWLTYELFGIKSEAYAWSFMLTHLLNVVLFFRVTHAFTKSAALAALGAALWGSSPLHAGTFDCYGIYGQVLAATALLFVLDRVAAWNSRIVPSRTALLWAFVLLIGAACFGVGLAVAMISPLFVLLLFQKPLRQHDVLATFLPFPLVVAVVYYGWRWLFARFFPMPTGELILHAMAFSDLPTLFAMLGHMLSIGMTALLQGFLFAPGTYPTSEWPLVCAYAGGMVGALVVTRNAGRRRILALLIIPIAVYGLIALGRANVYRMFKMSALDGARALRYHYVATIPLAMIIALVVHELGQRTRRAELVNGAAFAAWLLVNAYSYSRSSWKFDEHEEGRRYVASILREIDAEIDAHPVGSAVRIPNPSTLSPAMTGPVFSYVDQPGWAALFVLAYPSNHVRGRQVYFIEPIEKRGLFADPTNRRFSTLLVAP